jgi:Arc/MetJ-type ribon-helix-helix transcriptional regulator
MSEQIAIRLSNSMIAGLDHLVACGDFPSRAEAVRVAIARLIEQQRRQRIGNTIIEGRRRVPRTDDEIAAGEDAAIRSIFERPS